MIDIAFYLTRVEKAIRKAESESERRTGQRDQILIEDWFRVLLPELDAVARSLSSEISAEVMQKEGKTWSTGTTELNLLGFGVLLSAWGRWIFQSKSENPTYPFRSEAGAVSKHVESLVINVISAARKLGKGGGRPEDRCELIDII